MGQDCQSHREKMDAPCCLAHDTTKELDRLKQGLLGG